MALSSLGSFPIIRQVQRSIQHLTPVVWLAAVIGSQSGCVALALPVASSGIEYILANVAHRTFTVPEKRIYAASQKTLKKMGIVMISNAEIEGGHLLKGKTPILVITVEIKSVTAETTNVSVDARKNMMIRDKPVAVEILSQIAKEIEVSSNAPVRRDGLSKIR